MAQEYNTWMIFEMFSLFDFWWIFRSRYICLDNFLHGNVFDIHEEQSAAVLLWYINKTIYSLLTWVAITPSFASPLALQMAGDPSEGPVQFSRLENFHFRFWKRGRGQTNQWQLGSSFDSVFCVPLWLGGKFWIYGPVRGRINK